MFNLICVSLYGSNLPCTEYPFETENIKKTEIWPYTLENKVKFGLTNIKRKGYSEGLHQIENTPEVAPLDGEDVLKDSVTTSSTVSR